MPSTTRIRDSWISKNAIYFRKEKDETSNIPRSCVEVDQSQGLFVVVW